MGTYVPNGPSEIREMLKVIGVSDIGELYKSVPGEIKLDRELDLPGGKSEMEVASEMETISEKNKVFRTVLRGVGAYDHYIPSAVDQITSKEQFVTAYTPYQAEISQGILQSIFEYQTMICELTGMDVSNASVYDGATATAEAAAMCRDRKRNKVVISGTMNPEYIKVVKTYAFGSGMDVEVVPGKELATDVEALKNALDETAACVMLQQPNYFGMIENADVIGELAHASGAKYVMNCNPISLALLKTPAEYGADVAVGEGQPLGMPIAFGGPYLGFMAAKAQMARKLPGRIVGETVDKNGERGYVLTLQAREQHIRREKASSNICSNQALCALKAGVYLATMGREGLEDAAKLCASKAHYFADKLSKIQGVKLLGKGEFFHEFTAETPKADKVLKALASNGILGGYEYKENTVIWCVTEKVPKAELDRAAEIIAEVISK